jgi:hypothetical protein
MISGAWAALSTENAGVGKSHPWGPKNWLPTLDDFRTLTSALARSASGLSPMATSICGRIELAEASISATNYRMVARP